LETLAARPEGFGPGRGESALYITPGFEFRGIDALITNFHLPRSTPLLLASAFAGRERLLAAYREAVSLGYRLYSFGDATFVI
ncbi:MAG: S-adenosylmethionine:tRNA ribosyltransferase-isomerase, partial [Elusimicrobiota bacterium]|nr:S-adenosylmethionine:tRNA ribosyltransferase-isomerase [Elusimicrobiota bacterium]